MSMMESLTWWRKVSLSVVILVLAASQDGEGCSCFPAHKQQQFCEADFAMRFVIKSRKSNSVLTTPSPPFPGFSNIKYDVYKKKIYKSTPEFDTVLSKNFLYTSGSSASCGVQLKEKTKYFITGRVYGGKLQVGLCDWHEEWKNIPKRQRRLIKNGYGQHCDTCKIQTCFKNDERCKKSERKKDQCYWNFSSPVSQCYDRFALCKCKGAPKAATRCRWSYGRYLSGFVTCYQEAKALTKTASP